MNREQRTLALAESLREHEVHQLLVSAPFNVGYLSGYTGSNGVALVASSETSLPHRFFTDFRYLIQSQEQVGGWFEREIAQGDLLEALVSTLQTRDDAAVLRLGFDDGHLTVKQHRRLLELINGQAVELVPCAGMVERLREVKDAEELKRIKASAALADEALTSVLESGLVGRTELQVAVDLEFAMRRLGAEGASFPSIVAAGEHGALPHAEPREEEIPRGVLVTIDWGAVLDGYCSDCTRTFATGPLSEQATAVYELVLHAQMEALGALRAGLSGREVDAVARTIIEDAGHGEHFGHGLGHGVGLEVHEGPRLSRTATEEPLRVGNVVTVEPGVYLPGAMGVRIEDLVVLNGKGCELLNGLPKELTVV